MSFAIPDFCLVLLFGAPAASFGPDEVIAPDAALLDARLKQRELTVIDATALVKDERARLIAAASAVTPILLPSPLPGMGRISAICNARGFEPSIS